MRIHSLRPLAVLLLALVSCERATGIPFEPLELTVVAPTTTQSAAVLTLTPVDPTVRVTSESGRPVAGVIVAFAPVVGFGQAIQPLDTTDADGVASAQWLLGSRSGRQELRAFLPATTIETVIEFSAMAMAGPATALVLTTPVDTLSLGDSVALVVGFVDQQTNPTTAPGPVGFSIADTTVARVNAAGLLRTVGLGRTQLTISSGALVRQVSLVVRPPVPTIDVDTFPAAIASGFAISSSGIAYLSRPSRPLVAQVARFNVNSGSLEALLEISDISVDVAFDPSGATAYVATFPDVVTVMDAASGTVIRLDTLPAFPTRVLVSPDGAYLYATLQNGGVVQRAIPSGAQVIRPLLDGGNGIAMSASGDRLYVASSEGEVRSFALPSFTEIAAVTIGGTPQGLALSPDGSLLYVARELGALQVRRTSDLALVASAPAASNAWAVAVVGDGSYIVVTSQIAQVVRVLETTTLTVMRSFNQTDVRRLAVDPTSGDVWVSTDTPFLLRVRFP